MISGTDKVTYNLPPHIENHTNNSEGLGLEVVVQSSKKQKLMEGVSNERCMYPTSYDSGWYDKDPPLIVLHSTEVETQSSKSWQTLGWRCAQWHIFIFEHAIGIATLTIIHVSTEDGWNAEGKQTSQRSMYGSNANMIHGNSLMDSHKHSTFEASIATSVNGVKSFYWLYITCLALSIGRAGSLWSSFFSWLIISIQQWRQHTL